MELRYIYIHICVYIYIYAYDIFVGGDLKYFAFSCIFTLIWRRLPSWCQRGWFNHHLVWSFGKLCVPENLHGDRALKLTGLYRRLPAIRRHSRSTWCLAVRNGIVPQNFGIIWNHHQICASTWISGFSPMFRASILSHCFACKHLRGS